MTDIIDRIDEIVDEQLADYDRRSGYDHNVGQDRCPRCGRHWHGLPITAHIARMYQFGRYEPEYIAADDDSPIICEGSDFIGPIRSPWGIASAPRVAYGPAMSIIIGVDTDGFREAIQRFRDQMQEVAAAFSSMGQAFVRVSRSAGTYIDQITTITYDEWRPPRTPACLRNDINWTPGPHNWHHEFPRPSLQFPRTCAWGFRMRSPLEELVDDHWAEFNAPGYPLPETSGYDFTEYDRDQQHGPNTPGRSFR